jgi:hypothetical protein
MRPSDDTTPLAELRRNAIAALVVLGVVGIGAFAFMALRDLF